MLSFFSGIEVAALAVHQLIGPPLLHMTWEIDASCCEVISHHFPNVIHRGDVLKEDVNEVVRMLDRHDPHGTALILCTSSPPCPDFSTISSSAQGLQGEEGSKFGAYAKFVEDLDASVGGRTIHYLTENVVFQQRSEANYLSKRLKATPIIVDAADFGTISRPRMWWSRIDWSSQSHNPINNQELRWGKMHGFARLHIEGMADDRSTWTMEGAQFHPSVESGQHLMPCLTTPAPDDRGRPAPKKCKGKTDEATRNRWLSDNRQFAPWHYQEKSMLQDEYQQMILPSIGLKEQMHHLPLDFTGVTGASERTRHTMMGNSWHLGVVKFLLLFILQWTPSASLSVSPRINSLQWIISLSTRVAPSLGPGSWPQDVFEMPPAADMEHHWRLAQQCQHPALSDRPLEPGLVQTLQVLLHTWSDISRLRYEVVQEVQALVLDFQDQTEKWWHSLPAHVRQVYDHKEDGTITQVPIFLHLLQQCHYPGISHLQEDLDYGFNVLGPQHPGVGWLPRLDNKYEHPLDLDTFVQANKTYIFDKLRSSRVDPHWQVMLEEILSEKEKGKLSGPYAAPADWPIPTTTVGDLPLLPTPHGLVCPAWSFSVVQSDKIRRCEDYRRSFHNATVRARDSPHHHTIEVYAALSRFWLRRGHDSVTWAHDMDAAYRQLAVRDPQFSYVVLTTPQGHTLWRHNAMSFGAVASVWAFNRLADAAMFLGRQILLGPILHFVDDYGGCEPSTSAASTFECFAHLTAVLGLKMKAKKACPPQSRLKMLGVFIHCLPTEIQLQPCPDRVAKLDGIIQEALTKNELHPDTAQKLAGKLMFLQTTVFGGTGKAALQVVYARSAQNAGDNTLLNHALRAALMTLQKTLRQLVPRSLPVRHDISVTVLYTDAFFALGDQVPRKPSQAPKKWVPSHALRSDHGWGYVLSIQGQTFYAFGKAPLALLQKYCKRKAYIYFLELLAPVLVVAALHPLLTPFLLSFIDNQSGLMAISKGYGSDPAINGVIAFFWSLISALGWYPHFVWVPSEHNIADPISRRDTQIAHRHNWHLVEMDLQPVYDILLRCASDLNYATEMAVQDCLSLRLVPRSLQVLVHGGMSGHEVVVT